MHDSLTNVPSVENLVI